LCFYCFWGGIYTVCMIDSFCRYMNRKPQGDLSGTLRKVEGKHCVFNKRCFPNIFSQTYPSNIPYFPSPEFRSCNIPWTNHLNPMNFVGENQHFRCLLPRHSPPCQDAPPLKFEAHSFFARPCWWPGWCGFWCSWSRGKKSESAGNRNKTIREIPWNTILPSATVSDIPSGSIYGIFFWHSIWHSFWHSIWHLSCHNFSLAFYLTFSLASGWNLALADTEIWRLRLRSSIAHCDLALAV
jgi:hypothetical protein